MITLTQAVVDSATVALEKAPKGKGNKADIELIANDLASTNSAFAAAKADFDAGKFLAAKGKLEAVQSKARSIMAEIAAARARK